jgi:hypothetical protein
MTPKSSAPASLWAIALLALAPFPAASIAYVFGPDRYDPMALLVILTWSAVVLAFVGGVRWGMETVREIPRFSRMLGAVAPAVAAWVLLLCRGQTPTAWLLGGFLAIFILQWLFDHTAPDVPSRFPLLLTTLTLGAGVSLAFALEQALRM